MTWAAQWKEEEEEKEEGGIRSNLSRFHVESTYNEQEVIQKTPANKRAKQQTTGNCIYQRWSDETFDCKRNTDPHMALGVLTDTYIYSCILAHSCIHMYSYCIQRYSDIDQKKV
jgi:hypothetical protein